MIKVENIGQYLDALVKNDEVFESLKNRYPEILADIVSSRENPNCGCRNRTATHLTKKYIENDQEKAFIDSILSRQDVIDHSNQIEKEIQENISKNTYPKSKYILSKGDDSWNAFANWMKTNNVQFKSFSVVEKETHLEVYVI